MANSTFAFTFSFTDGSTYYQQAYTIVDTPRVKPQVQSLLPETIEEIEAELDIIRGRVPTPKGYNIDKDRAKLLMQRLKELTD